MPVVEAHNRVEGGVIEDVAAEWCTSAVGHGPGWKDESNSSAPSGELQRTFDEQLIPVDM
jgi:hypothetical protein